MLCRNGTISARITAYFLWRNSQNLGNVSWYGDVATAIFEFPRTTRGRFRPVCWQREFARIIKTIHMSLARNQKWDRSFYSGQVGARFASKAPTKVRALIFGKTARDWFVCVVMAAISVMIAAFSEAQTQTKRTPFMLTKSAVFCNPDLLLSLAQEA